MTKDLKKCLETINQIQDKYIGYYDNTKINFEVGEHAWIADRYGDPIEVKIVEIEDFGENCYKFYWINFSDVSKFEILFEKIKFYSWLYFFRLLGFSQFNINPRLGPGHGVLCGKCETIFKTKEEAIINFFCQETKFNITDLKYKIEEIQNQNQNSNPSLIEKLP